MDGGRHLLAGLSTEQARDILATSGPNTMPLPRRESWVRHLLRGLTHAFALMLWAAAVLAVIAGLPAMAIAIVAVVVINAVFALIQEARADHAANRLQALLPTRATVVRDGRRCDVDSSEVVVGDWVVLAPGDRIPADGVVDRAVGLALDTSTLTGESRPEWRRAGDRVFAGTFVVEGEGDALIDATGGSTRLADITRMSTATPKPVTPLARELRTLVRVIALIAIAVGGLFFLVSLLLGREPAQGFLLAIGVTVALVPEALLPTVTLTLAWGAERMARRNVLVRHLEAVETLGSTTVICTDKTGTLTCNEMTVVRAWTPGAELTGSDVGYDPSGAVCLAEGSMREELQALAALAVQASDGMVQLVGGSWRSHGDPMEAAIDCCARRLGLDTDEVRSQVVARYPFDPRRRRMSAVVPAPEGGAHIAVKGALDSLAMVCLPSPGLAAAEEIASQWAQEGLRILAVGQRSMPVLPRHGAHAEDSIEFCGLLGLEDPPRPDVAEALAACRRAGIGVVMVTGDHPSTASAIADQVGLRQSDGVVITGAHLPRDDAELARLLSPGGVVVARVEPEDKLRIARALRNAGEVVAMTGDGVNDVPALHASSIGIAMGKSGTDVAREAADLVLLDDHFGSIVAGIEQGRATFVNVRRFLTYHLTDNVAELTPFLVWAVSGGTFPLAIGVLQVLALDIGTDTLTAAALGAEPPARHVLDGPPVRGRLLNHTVLRRAFAVLGPTEAVASMTVFAVVLSMGAAWGQAPATVIAAASGAAFMTIVVAQLANAWACRSSSRSPWQLGWLANRLMLPAALGALAFALCTVFIPYLATALGQAPPPGWAWGLIVLAAPLLWIVDAAEKGVRARVMKRRLG